MTRPALADVLAVVTTCDDAAWWRVMLTDAPTRLAPEGVEWEMGGGVPWARLRGWTHTSPADALAALVEAELLPAHWCDPERAPRWWCDDHDPRDEDHDGPPSHATLVAVASLGADTLARAEAIVAETWRARVVWRVMTAEELVLRHEEMARNGDGQSAVYVTAHEHARARNPKRFGGLPAWPEECPWMSLPPIVRAWPALRALAALGLHQLAVDGGRVTLGVEAL